MAIRQRSFPTALLVGLNAKSPSETNPRLITYLSSKIRIHHASTQLKPVHQSEQGYSLRRPRLVNHGQGERLKNGRTPA